LSFRDLAWEAASKPRTDDNPIQPNSFTAAPLWVPLAAAARSLFDAQKGNLLGAE
jgi:hypothetical protein